MSPLSNPPISARAITPSANQSNAIVRASIYPSIGVARIGNSPEDFFLAPEVVDPQPQPHGFYRDASGALKRQVVRFRIYGLNALGNVVAELTQSNAEITWSVHLANKKAAWYQFQIALDIPEADSAPHSYLRNAAVGDRKQLVIDPGACEIMGANTRGSRYIFDTGKFMGTTVYLGELRTDEQGRLLVFGGRGKSASCDGSPAITFANNEGWYDDTADGPVTATIRYQGKPLDVDPAWVVVAPPNYAPMQKSVRTMWDLMRDTAIKAKKLPKPARPSFNTDIRPIFERLSRLQWVNAGFAAAFGWGGPNNYATDAWLARLGKNDPAERHIRRGLANQFRNYKWDSWSPKPWPWMYGDAMNIPTAETPRQNSTLSETQLDFLMQWAEGDFEADYDPQRAPFRKLEEVPLADQPDMLDRASLEFCLADAFHPGCEMTWPMRQKSLYMAPFRIHHAPTNFVEPQYGAVLISSDIIWDLPLGPLGPQVPGGITRWMAVPWQTDTASCRSGYDKKYDPYLPTFWAARVPNQVLTEDNYKIVMDSMQPLDQRLAAFARRTSWDKPLNPKADYPTQIQNMVNHFGDMGVVEHREGPGDPNFPDSLEVQDLPAHTQKRLAALALSSADKEETELTGIEKVHRFPHGLRD
jgi:hypothetical protein